jgi:hypothetical protein
MDCRCWTEVVRIDRVAHWLSGFVRSTAGCTIARWICFAGVILAADKLAHSAEAKPRPDPTRYTGLWIDGTRLSGETLGPWHETKSSPKLAGRDLFDANQPIRWLIDNALPVAGAPDAVIELAGGDCLPGRVIGYSDGSEAANRRLPPHVTVAATTPVDWPDGPSRPHLRVTLPWLKRIVWQRIAHRYQPRTLFLADGRQVAFRSVRFSAAGLQVLREGEIREFGLGEIAELHLPPIDPWDAYFDQLSGFSPGPGVRLVRWETSTGIRVTGTTERFQARSHGAADQPANWLHLVQPAWCLDPLWIRHDTIRVRAYFLPHEVPLTRIEPAAARSQSDLGGGWPWQLDRNVESGPLESGGAAFPWGFGVHAASELEFPLPPAARAMRTRLGLDHLAGRGGCVRASIYLGSTRTQPIYSSNWIVGSGEVSDTGRLALPGPPNQPDRLILQVDPAHAGRPAGADPLDIRDALDWLEPAITLDAERVPVEVLLRSPRRIAAWQGWKVTMGDAEAVRLVSRWDESDPRDLGYRLLAAVGQEPLRLTGKLVPRPYRDQLLLQVSRPTDSTPSRLEVRLDGLPVVQFDVPVRGSPQFPPLIVPLGAYHHREATVDLIQYSQDERALVEWGAINLVNRTAVQ